MRVINSLIPLPFLAAALAGCQQPKQIYASGAYVRLPAVQGRPAVAYFTLHGGEKDATLISVTSPAVIRSELHESMMHGAVSSMAPVDDVKLPKKGRIAFAPGGRHVMLFGLNKTVAAGGTMTLVLTFADALRIEVDAPVIAAGDPAPEN